MFIFDAKMQKKTVIVLVSSDLVTDNRVARTCGEMHELGMRVELIGRKKKSSIPMTERPYKTKRINTLFEKGALFYASLNVQFFFLLLFRKVDGIFSNDLDTLLPAFLISKLKKVPIIYDSHELFTEVPELTSRPRIQNIWKRIEGYVFPKLTHVITVNSSIATEFEEKYNKKLHVIRNVPYRYQIQHTTRAALDLPEDKFIAIIQGSGLNIGRGVEESIQAISDLKHVMLLIVGDGDVIPYAKKLVNSLGIEDQIRFISRLPYLEMMKYTEAADLGLSLDRALCLNYTYSLPNKIFDYLNANTPILCTNLKEVSQLVQSHKCGVVLSDFSIESLKREIEALSLDREKMLKLKENCRIAAQIENWENERKILHSVLESVFL
jgi:glycosyltransferase involved in cell wall biosynthesis